MSPWNRCDKIMADSCRVKEGGVDATATIKRHEGLWFSIPSDYNYCHSNNKYFTNIAIKMYWHINIHPEGSTSSKRIYTGINKYSDKLIDSTNILYSDMIIEPRVHTTTRRTTASTTTSTTTTPSGDFIAGLGSGQPPI